MRKRYGWGCLMAAMVVSVGGLSTTEALAQRCSPCLIRPNPKDRNPDRREDRPNTLQEPDIRDSVTRPASLPGGADARTFVPAQDASRDAGMQPGDVAPAENLPPDPTSR
ncbi:MAG: hypothetical protein JWQ72_3432 [Polaromonas sp.]|nr:hypothetical protein [Polaromonas sp.]